MANGLTALKVIGIIFMEKEHLVGLPTQFLPWVSGGRHADALWLYFKRHRLYDSEWEECIGTVMTISLIYMCQLYTATFYNEFLAIPKVTMK